MESRDSGVRTIRIGKETGKFIGINENDFYFKSYVVDNIESEFNEICSSIFPTAGTAIDVGANLGLKTFTLAKLAGNDGNVISIEGSPRVAAALKKNILINDLRNVSVENVACSDKDGTVTFCDNSAWGHILAAQDLIFDVNGEGTISHEISSRQNVISVPAMTLDSIAQKYNISRLDFIKIDTEGHDLAVLKGASGILSRFNPFIYTEFVSVGLSIHGDVNPKDFIEYVFSKFQYVYQIKRIGNGRLKKIDRKDRFALLYENMAFNSSMDDLLITNNSEASSKLASLLWTGEQNNIYPSLELGANPPLELDANPRQGIIKRIRRKIIPLRFSNAIRALRGKPYRQSE